MANGMANERRDCLLRVDNIRKSFGEQAVLRDVSLEVDKGDVVAILGPSGSGKTTLLRCLNFLERADGGTLTFDGETFDLQKAAKRDIARLRRKTAFVFQSYNLFLNKTALGNIMEGLVVARKMPKAEAKAIGMKMLEKVGLADRADAYPAELSGGQQQRVAVARALATEPALILADEPTGNLDSKTGKEIMSLFCQLNEAGKTIILITHSEAVAQQTHRRIRIMDGRVRDCGDETDPFGAAEVSPEKAGEDA